MKAAHPEAAAATRENPGEILRQARESRDWSQAEVARKLNLTVSSLNNLEAGAFDKLPGHTFARGYIRAYAKLLDMDQATLVQAFDQCTGTHAQGSDVHALGRIEEPVRLSHNILRIVSLVLLVVVIGGGFFWWQDQTSLRGKDLANMALEHVEVESADGTTQIHPLDEPEDQAVTAGQQPQSTTLNLEQASTPAEQAGAAPAEQVATEQAPAAQAPASPAAAPAASAALAPAAPAARLCLLRRQPRLHRWSIARLPQHRQHLLLQPQLVAASCTCSSTPIAGLRSPMATARCCSAPSSARATAWT